ACVTNNSSAASIYMYGVISRMNESANTGGTHVIDNGTIYINHGCDFDGGTKFFDVKCGKYLQCIGSFGSINGSDAVTIAGTGLALIGFSSLANMATNGNMVNLTESGAVAGITNSYLDLPAGTGYIVTGVAGSIYTYANNS